MNAMLNNFIFLCLAVIATSAPIPDARMIRTARSTDVIDHVSIDQTSYNTELFSEIKTLLSLLIQKSPKNNLETLKCEVATNPLKKVFVFSNLEGKSFPNENPSYSTKIKVPNRNSFVEINYYDLKQNSSDNHNITNTTQESGPIKKYSDDILNSTKTINPYIQNNALYFESSLNKSSQFEQNTNSLDNEENFTKRYNMADKNTLLVMDLKLNNDSHSTSSQHNDIEWSKNSANTASREKYNSSLASSVSSEINKSQTEVPTIGQITQNVQTPFFRSNDSSSESTKVIYQETQYNLQNKNNINFSTQSIANEDHHTSQMTFKIHSSDSTNMDSSYDNYVQEITSKSIQLLNKTEIHSQPSTNHNLIEQTTNKNIDISIPFIRNSLSTLNNDISEMPNFSESNNITNVISKDTITSKTDSSYTNTLANNNSNEYKINLSEYELKQHVTTPIYTGDTLFEGYIANNNKSTVSLSANTNTGNEFNYEISDSTSETVPLIYSTNTLSNQNRYYKEENWNEPKNTTESDRLLTNSSNNFIRALLGSTNPNDTPIYDTEVTSSSLFHTYSTTNLSYISLQEESVTSNINNVFITKATEIDTVITDKNSKDSSLIITSVFDKNTGSSNSKNFEITTPAYFSNPQTTNNLYSDINIITTNDDNDNALYDYRQNTIETENYLVVTHETSNMNSDKFEIGFIPTESITLPSEQNMDEKTLQSTAEVSTENVNLSRVSPVIGVTNAFENPFSYQGHTITINDDSSTLEFPSSTFKLNNTIHKESSASMGIHGEINIKSSPSITDIESNKKHYTTESETINDYSDSDKINNDSKEIGPENHSTIVDIITELNKLSVYGHSTFLPELKEESSTQITSNYTLQENNVLFASSSTAKSTVEETELISEDNNQIPESNSTGISTTESNYTLPPLLEITTEISNIEVRPTTENDLTSVSKLFNYSTNNIFISTPDFSSSKVNMSATYSSFEAKDITKVESENNSNHYTEAHLMEPSTIRTTAMMDFNNFTFSLPSTQHVIAFIPLKVHSIKSVGQIL